MANVTFVDINEKSAILNASCKWGKQPLNEDEFELVLSKLTIGERGLLNLDRDLLAVQVGDFKRTVTPVSLDPNDIVRAIKEAIQQVYKKQTEQFKESLDRLSAITQNPEEVVSDNFGVYQYSQNFIDKSRKNAVLAEQADKAEQAIHEFIQERRSQWVQVITKTLNEAKPDEDFTAEFLDHNFSLKQIQKKAKEFNVPMLNEALQNYLIKLDAHEKEQEEIIKQSQENWKEIALHLGSPALIRAIEKGYPVGRQIEDEILEELRPNPPEDTYLRYDSVTDHGDRKVPKMKAYEIQDQLNESIKNSIVPKIKGTTIEVGRIRSVEFYAECPCGGAYDCEQHDSDGEVLVKRTAIPVTITAPHVNQTCWYVIEE